MIRFSAAACARISSAQSRVGRRSKNQSHSMFRAANHLRILLRCVLLTIARRLQWMHAGVRSARARQSTFLKRVSFVTQQNDVHLLVYHLIPYKWNENTYNLSFCVFSLHTLVPVRLCRRKRNKYDDRSLGFYIFSIFYEVFDIMEPVAMPRVPRVFGLPLQLPSPANHHRLGRQVAMNRSRRQWRTV